MTRTQRADISSTGQHSISTRVVEAVAAEEGISPLELDPPLYDTIDPDALDTLFGPSGFVGTIEFDYLGYQVWVHGDGRIDVQG